jgi:L-iditol 2-dehydrogenase
MEPLSVALHAVKQAGIKEGDSVAIVGTGMIGFAAAQWAQKLKAEKVTVIGRSLNKKVLSDAIGNLDYFIMDEVEDEHDVVIEAVGSNNAIDKSINIVKAGGTLVLMGNPEGDIELLQNTYWRILRKQLYIVGTWNSHYESTGPSDWSEVKEALNNKSIKVENLISHTYGQENLKNGLEIMKSHKEPYCKVMTVWNEQDEVCR